MDLETRLDEVEFACRRCGRSWLAHYEVLSCHSAAGEAREYFGLHGLLSLSPYDPSGAQSCPGCGAAVVGRRTARQGHAQTPMAFELAASPTARRLTWREDFKPL